MNKAHFVDKLNAGLPTLFLSSHKTLFNTLNKSVHRRANRFSGMVSAHCRNGLRLFAKRQFN